MADRGTISTRWLPPMSPEALPLGKSNIYPSGEPHAVSASVPTWDSVIGLAREDKWVVDTMEWSYPRFLIVRPVEQLAEAVLKRLEVDGSNTSCMMFYSKTAAGKCISHLEACSAYSERPSVVETTRFYMPAQSNLGPRSDHWANFSAILFSPELWADAMAFWRDTGAGLSTRHTEFCLEELDYLDSESPNPALRTPAPRKRNHRQMRLPLTSVLDATPSINELKAFIAQLATSDQPDQPDVSLDDVLLYPSGMNAIYSVSESMSSLNTNSTVAAYG